ncbi:putative mRNA capping enzyme; beta chain [Paratrimastix pyriformis]|uniref:mRNA 5'-phosphatase n=1 Tax=Paratrimastix pyriformis TaxID=342808 RepID=A0ABQ8UN10_9EUKA|nr:putative mRNA capping enzyme; beta chain [Paratrimastix pyriformis]
MYRLKKEPVKIPFGPESGDGLLQNQVFRFISEQLPKKQHIEIEARLGLALSQESQSRLNFPISVDATLEPGQHVFRSQVTESLFVALKEHLSRQPMQASMGQTTDEIYGHFRVTTNADGSKTAIMKGEKEHLDIYCPKSCLDLRITAASEDPVNPQEAAGRQPEMVRQKTRFAFTTPDYEIDLTQVKSQGLRVQQAEQHAYEVEMECTKHFVDGLRREFGLLRHNQPNCFFDRVQAKAPSAQGADFLPASAHRRTRFAPLDGTSNTAGDPGAGGPAGPLAGGVPQEDQESETSYDPHTPTWGGEGGGEVVEMGRPAQDEDDDA